MTSNDACYNMYKQGLGQSSLVRGQTSFHSCTAQNWCLQDGTAPRWYGPSWYHAGAAATRCIATVYGSGSPVGSTRARGSRLPTFTTIIVLLLELMRFSPLQLNFVMLKKPGILAMYKVDSRSTCNKGNTKGTKQVDKQRSFFIIITISIKPFIINKMRSCNQEGTRFNRLHHNI